MDVVTVWKSGTMKGWKRGIESDAVLNISWQHGVTKASFVYGSPRPPFILFESSIVSGMTIEWIMSSFRMGHFYTVTEHVDYYGAFYTDYMLVDEKVYRVEEVLDDAVRLRRGRDVIEYEYNFGPDDFNYEFRPDNLVLHAINSWKIRRPAITGRAWVYMVRNDRERLIKRTMLALEGVKGDYEIVPLRKFKYTTPYVLKKFLPLKTRALLRLGKTVPIATVGDNDVAVSLVFTSAFIAFRMLGGKTYHVAADPLDVECWPRVRVDDLEKYTSLPDPKVIEDELFSRCRQ